MSDRLILTAHFNASHCTRADVRPQRQAVVIANVVIDAQRIEAGAFEDREVTDLRRQGLIREWYGAFAGRRRTSRWEAGESAGSAESQGLHHLGRPNSLNCLAGRCSGKDDILFDCAQNNGICLGRERCRIREEVDLTPRSRSQLQRSKRQSHLRCIKRNEPEVALANVGKSRFMPPRNFVRKIVIRLILLDRSAERCASLHSCVGRIRNRAEWVHCLEIPVAQVAVDVAVEVVRS